MRTNLFVCTVCRSRGTARRVVVPYDRRTHPSVGRGHVPAACRNYRLRTSLFVCTVCRFAVGGDMSPPYRHGKKPAVGDGVLDVPCAGTTKCVQGTKKIAASLRSSQ